MEVATPVNSAISITIHYKMVQKSKYKRGINFALITESKPVVVNPRAFKLC